MKSKYLKVFIISLLGCCIAIGEIHSYQTKNHEAQKDFSNENTDSYPASVTVVDHFLTL